MRQCAWLDAPLREKKTLQGDSEQSFRTRRSLLAVKKRRPDLPECGPAEYLIAYLQDMDWFCRSGMGNSALSSQEVLAWQVGTGIELDSWEFRSVLTLSREFLSQLHQSEKPDCPAPYIEEPDHEQQQRVIKSIEKVFEARIARAEKRKSR